MPRINKDRKKLFEIIREIYETEILTCDLSLESMPSYFEAYTKVAYMLEGIHAAKFVVKRQLGEDFYKWFFETHEEISTKFFKGEI